MDSTNLISFFLSSLFLASLPGPAMMLVIQGSIKHGWKAGNKVASGILLGDIALLLVVCSGIGGIITQIPVLLLFMKIFSTIYLIYLGISSLIEAYRVHSESAETNLKVTWKSGFLITVINPKTIIFLVAYFPQFIDYQSNLSEINQLLILSFYFLIAVACVMFFYAFSAHKANRFLESKKTRSIMSALFGLLLIFIAVYGI